MKQEPEFKSEYENARKNCSEFAVAILDSCRNSSEVEQVLNGKDCLIYHSGTTPLCISYINYPKLVFQDPDPVLSDLMHDSTELCTKIRKASFRIHIAKCFFTTSG